MAAPPPSNLDANQCIRGSFEELTGRLRVDSIATVINGDIDVSLSSFEDNVAICDSAGNELSVNPDGSINVNTGASALVLKSYYTEVTGIVMGLTTLVGTYTAAVDGYLQKVQFSGTNIAEYELVIDGNTEDKERTYFGNSLNGTFDFNNGLKVLTGSVVDVYVIHSRPTVGDFNARIQILE